MGCREGDMDLLDWEVVLILGEFFLIFVDFCFLEGFCVFFGLLYFVIMIVMKIFKENMIVIVVSRIILIFFMFVGVLLLIIWVGIIDDLVFFMIIEFVGWCVDIMFGGGVGFVSLSVDLVDLICLLYGVDWILYLCL